eukprot:5153161-Amphidinium_carterae.1
MTEASAPMFERSMCLQLDSLVHCQLLGLEHHGQNRLVHAYFCAVTLKAHRVKDNWIASAKSGSAQTDNRSMQPISPTCQGKNRRCVSESTVWLHA